LTGGKDNSIHVVDASGTNAASLLDGFTVTAGYADMSGYSGAGMVMSDGRATVRYCTFTENFAFGSGAAIYVVAASAPVIVGCAFVDNEAVFSGAAIASVDSTPTVSDCTFDAESVQLHSGGAIANYSSSMTITDCVFTGCTAHDVGGAISNLNSSVALTNCLFVNNTARLLGDDRGGALYDEGGTITVTNCTFTGNGVFTSEGGAIYNTGGATLNVRNSILWGDLAAAPSEIVNAGGMVSVSFSDVQGGFAGTGNIAADPLFISGTNRRLKLASPCVDVGNNAAVPMGVIQDLSGANRFINIPGVHDPGAIVDMGAYERVPGTLTLSNRIFLVDTHKPILKFEFNAEIAPSSLDIDDLVLRNLTTGATLIPSRWGTFAYDARERTATWTFTMLLPDGDYQALLPAESVTDPFGYPLGGDVTHEFFVLAGDANRDRRVNLQDFNILAANFGRTSAVFTQGDFNYDGTVNLQDFNILAGRFGQALGPDGTVSGAEVWLPPSSPRSTSMSGNGRDGLDDDDIDDTEFN
jgi:predicted outer membrane repeat protein